MESLDTIDLVDPDVYVRGVPYAEFARLRRDDPVSWQTERGGTGYWAVTRFDDITEISRQPAIFSSAHEWGGHRLFNENEVGVGSTGDEGFGIPFISRDPPIHTQYRKFTMPAVSPARLGDIEARIRERAATLIENIPFGEAIDMIDALNGPLPLMTLAELLGVSSDLWSSLYSWTNTFVAEDDPDFRESPEILQQKVTEFLGFCRHLFDTRREQPGVDIASLLATTEIQGKPIGFSDFAASMMLVVVGGNETTRNSLGQSMVRFAENPEQWDAIVAEPTLLKNAVREMVRHATPVLHMRRTATVDTELRGKMIKRGDKIILWYAAGNRDPLVFENPDKFDIRRGNINHVGFGTGQHVCIGSRLAEMQLRVAFEILAGRVKSFELIEEPKRLRSNFINGLKTLKMRLHPA